MEDFNSETDSDYTSYWRDWVCAFFFLVTASPIFFFFFFARIGMDALTMENVLLRGYRFESV